ncbi:olfactory receptor 6N2-like [Lithobates pipiens]
MQFPNHSKVNEIMLVGFPGLQRYSVLLFIVLLFIYIFIIAGNVLIFFVIRREPCLHFPMYIFIGALSFAEIWYTAILIPKILTDLLDDEKKISLTGCLLQAYFAHVLGASESYILTVMAFDRYLAICKPLHYLTIMNIKLYVSLIAGSFILGFLLPIIEVVLISHLPFCGPNHIENVLCDFPPLIAIACTDPTFYVLVEFFVSLVIISTTFPLVLLSYIRIVYVILKIKSKEGRRKAFSTCGAHLIVVILFFSSASFMYIRVSKSSSVNYDRAVDLTYVIFTPLVNPIIYGLKNHEIKKSIHKYLCPC